ATTPVTLTNTGDFIDLFYTFTANSSNIPTASSFLFTGLYNSGGVAPLPGTLASSGLSSTAGSANATGGTQLWQGYVTKVSGTGGTSSSSSVAIRPMQSG